MSIAVTVLIRPSPLLRLLLVLLAAMSALSAVLIFLFTFHLLPAANVLLMCLPVGMASLGLLLSAFRARKSFLLDISGTGQIRLREHYTGAAQAWLEETSPPLPRQTVRLLEGSTLWPCLLALRLEGGDGKKLAGLVILPDSLAPGAFRALSLALRSIEGRVNEGASKQL